MPPRQRSNAARSPRHVASLRGVLDAVVGMRAIVPSASIWPSRVDLLAQLIVWPIS